ncbi:MAG: diacylglycerol kinase family lipid kinase [Alkalibacterium sp.]|nr:diacylglycerol kinase family lipid kinase [Alkalibacterium sp.]
MKKAMIIANPSSGKKNGEEYALYAKKRFTETGWDCEVQFTQQKSDITKYTALASQEKKDYLIIIGGDGTVSETINALNHTSFKPIIGIIPTGTVNNVARGLGLKLPVENVVDQLINSVERSCDVGDVNGRLFMSSISAGTIPETVWDVSDDMKERYGSLAYFIEGLKSLRNEETHRLEMEIDGVTHTKEVSLILIGASHNILGIPHFFEDAEMDDGRLHLFMIKQTTFGQKVVIFSKLLSENEENVPSEVTIDSFKEAKIKLVDKQTHVAMDGEKGPEFPLTVKVRPSFLTVLTPQID